MTTEEMIAILKAKKDGKVVEFRHHEAEADNWRISNLPYCDFINHDYRLHDKWAEVKVAWRAGKPIERLNKAVCSAKWTLMSKFEPESTFDLPEMKFRIKPDPFAKYKEAYKQGKNVQWLDGEVWKDIEPKGWYFDSPKFQDTKYRIVTKKVVPWTVDEVPVGAAIKAKISGTRCLIHTVDPHNISFPVLACGRWWDLVELCTQFDVCDACGKEILGPCGTVTCEPEPPTG